MKLQRFDVSDTPQLTVVCHGDLDINGGRRGELAVKGYGGEEDLEILQDGEHFTITSQSRCKIGCPRGTRINLETVSGDLRVQRLEGEITIGTVRGDTQLKEVGTSSLQAALGDVRVRAVSGDLRLEQVGGDMSVRGVEGMLACPQVGGDLSAAYLEGGLEATVGGDTALKTDFAPGCTYQLTTGGDASVKFPTNANARVEITARGDIDPNVDWTEVEQSRGRLQGRVGDGEAEVTIEAGGDVSLRSRSDSGAFVFSFTLEDENLEADFETMADELERNIEAHMAHLNEELNDKLSRIDYEAVRRKAERAAEKMRRKAEQAAERARMQADRAQRRWERMGGEPRAPHAPRPPQAQRQAEPVTEEERLMILRMVQEGKISTDDAARLLEALEG
jgi:hypothetical protein